MVRENINVTMPEPAKVVRRFANGDEILGRYVVQSELGQGGMGVVYECFDKIGGVEVAVKGLPPEVSHNSDEMEAVRENFQLVSELHHPNIAGVRTLEKDSATGDYYLVMTLARGVSLRHWLRQHGGKEHRAEQLNVLRQIASALDYAHNAEPKHIIHRDVKPENIMVDDGGHVMVLDFGLAAQVRSSLSRVSQVVISRSGTPAYKSPEQWLAQAQRAPSDQYSLGVIAYQMFTGELPFDSDDIEILKHAVVFDPVPEIPDETKPVNAVFAKTLAKRPQDRFASCATFVAALEGKDVCGVSPARRSRSGLALVGIAVLAAIAGGVWMLQHPRVQGESGSVHPVASVERPVPAMPMVKTQIVEKVVERVVEKPTVTRSAALADARQFHIKTALSVANEYKTAERWQDCISEAEKVLVWEPTNAEAFALKREAERHLVPTLRFVAKIGDREVEATAMFGGKPFKSPWVWNKGVKTGSRIPNSDIAVEYSEGGKLYRGLMKSQIVNWSGLKVIEVDLAECLGNGSMSVAVRGNTDTTREISGKTRLTDEKRAELRAKLKQRVAKREAEWAENGLEIISEYISDGEVAKQLMKEVSDCAKGIHVDAASWTAVTQSASSTDERRERRRNLMGERNKKISIAVFEVVRKYIADDGKAQELAKKLMGIRTSR